MKRWSILVIWQVVFALIAIGTVRLIHYLIQSGSISTSAVPMTPATFSYLLGLTMILLPFIPLMASQDLVDDWKREIQTAFIASVGGLALSYAFSSLIGARQILQFYAVLVSAVVIASYATKLASETQLGHQYRNLAPTMAAMQSTVVALWTFTKF